MKKSYLFFLLFSVSLIAFSQQDCEDAHSDIIYAYSHVKSAYDSNNIHHLKDYSNRSFEAFERAKKILGDCGCHSSYDKAYDASDLLSKVENAETFEDGRFYVKRAREIAKEVIDELEQCTKLTEEDEAMVELNHERLKLKQQQIELKLKEEKLKQQLAQKEAKEIQLKKEQLIQKNNNAISANISTFNDVLDACNCEAIIEETNYKKDNLIKKNLVDIKKEYLNIFKKMTTEYLEKLNACTD